MIEWKTKIPEENGVYWRWSFRCNDNGKPEILTLSNLVRQHALKYLDADTIWHGPLQPPDIPKEKFIKWKDMIKDD